MKDVPRLGKRARLSVGMFTYSTEPRGSVVHAAALAEALLARGCDVSLYALNKGGGFHRQVACNLRLVPAGPAPKGEALVRQRLGELVAYMNECNVVHDVYHAQDCLTANALMLSSALTRGRVFRTVHHIEEFECPYLSACQTRSIADADALCAVSHATAYEVKERFGRRAQVVGNGVTASRLCALPSSSVVAARARVLNGLAGPLLLSVGGVEPRKNAITTLDAFVRVKQLYPGAVWAIVGGATALDHGDYTLSFERAVQSHGYSKDVVRLGVVDEVSLGALFGAADVLLNVSTHEGFGLTILEALAAGVPVVASNAAPFDEYLSSDSAFLVDPTSALDIARGTISALVESTRCQLAGRTVALSHAWEKVAARTQLAYADHWGSLLRGGQEAGVTSHA